MNNKKELPNQKWIEKVAYLLNITPHEVELSFKAGLLEHQMKLEIENDKELRDLIGDYGDPANAKGNNNRVTELTEKDKLLEETIRELNAKQFTVDKDIAEKIEEEKRIKAWEYGESDRDIYAEEEMEV